MENTKDRMDELCKIKFKQVRLRRFELGDEADVYEYSSDPVVFKYLTWCGLTERSQVRRFIERCYVHNPWVFAIIHKATEKCIGAIELKVNMEQKKASVGYLLNRKFWEKGIMSELVQKCVAFCFEELKLELIEATHFAGNFASGRVLVKAGFEVDIRVHQQVKVKEHFFEEIYYSLSKEKYCKMKK
ncbi:MAG: GNAT family N-acetyltransferase [bacterium]|nr:GNAT family N-acetyltransferase [bacterium]